MCPGCGDVIADAKKASQLPDDTILLRCVESGSMDAGGEASSPGKTVYEKCAEHGGEAISSFAGRATWLSVPSVVYVGKCSSRILPNKRLKR